MTMEKLGVQDKDLLVELQAEYQTLKEKEASFIKTGAALDIKSVRSELSAIASKIDQISKK